MMNQDFSKTVRSLKLASLAPRSRPRPPLAPSMSLPCLDARERIEAVLAPFLDQLIDEIPGLRRHRRMYDGAWVVGLSATLPRQGRRPATACTRLEFAIDILDSGRRASVACHATVADVELALSALEVALDDAGCRTLAETFEAASLAFAKRYFAATARSR